MAVHNAVDAAEQRSSGAFYTVDKAGGPVDGFVQQERLENRLAILEVIGDDVDQI